MADDEPREWGKLIYRATVGFDAEAWRQLLKLCALERIGPAEALRRMFARGIGPLLDEADEVQRVRAAKASETRKARRR